MFKIGSFEAELASNMRKELYGNQLENKYSFEKLSKVADYLDAAAEILDRTGFVAHADALGVILQSLADGKPLKMVITAEELDEVKEPEIIIEPPQEILEQSITPNPVVDKGLEATKIAKQVNIHDTAEYATIRSIAEKIAKDKKKV